MCNCLHVRVYFLFREKKLGSVGASGLDLSSRDADRRVPTSWHSESIAARHLADDSQMPQLPAPSTTGSDL